MPMHPWVPQLHHPRIATHKLTLCKYLGEYLSLLFSPYVFQMSKPFQLLFSTLSVTFAYATTLRISSCSFVYASYVVSTKLFVIYIFINSSTLLCFCSLNLNVHAPNVEKNSLIAQYNTRCTLKVTHCILHFSSYFIFHIILQLKVYLST